MLAAVNSDAGSLVSLADIRAAAERIQGVVLRSPVIALPHPADPDRLLHCKAESLQPTGAFKLRGAYNTISQVLETARDRKSTRLNSSHVAISYAVFCLKKKTNQSSVYLNSVCDYITVIEV